MKKLKFNEKHFYCYSPYDSYYEVYIDDYNQS